MGRPKPDLVVSSCQRPSSGVDGKAETQPSFQKWYVDGETCLRPLAALSGGLRWPFWPFYFLRVFDVLLSLARPSPLSVRQLLDLFNFKTLFVHRMDCHRERDLLRQALAPLGAMSPS